MSIENNVRKIRKVNKKSTSSQLKYKDNILANMLLRSIKQSRKELLH